MEKKVIVKDFSISHQHGGAKVTADLLHDKEGESHTYSFEGYIEGADIERTIDIVTVNNGTVPLADARELWEILAKTCSISQTVELRETLWR